MPIDDFMARTTRYLIFIGRKPTTRYIIQREQWTAENLEMVFNNMN